jgi:solute carrier family 13 (sodium-dependent dicarboxylate transporter), member 2/3/5
MRDSREFRMSKLLTLFLCAGLPLAIALLPLQMSPAAGKALAISAGMILFWIFVPLDHAVTGLMGCFLYWATGTVKVETAFNGFAQDTPWFLYGAIILGATVARTGLARRLAYSVMSAIGVSYGQILAGIIVVNFLLTFIVPSATARVVILASISLGIVEAFGAAPKSNIARGLFIVFTYTATIFDKMLIAGASSLVARGLIEHDGGVPVYYSQWFFAYLPCDLLTILACWAAVMWLYPPEKKRLAEGRAYIDAQLAKLGPFTNQEKRACVLMAVTLGLWLTDFLHHIPASVIGLGAGLAACLPGAGLMDSEDLKRLDLSAVFLTAAVLSMAAVLGQTKAMEVINAAFFSRVTPFLHSVTYSAFILYWAGFVYHFFLPEPSNISTSMPLLMSFARSNNLSPLAIGMIWTFASGGKIFMYQSPVLVVGYSYGQFEAKDLLKVGLILTVVEALILLLLVPTFWPLIGVR